MYIPIAAISTPAPSLSRRRIIIPTVADGFPRAFTMRAYSPLPQDEQQRLRLSEVGFFFIPFAFFI